MRNTLARTLAGLVAVAVTAGLQPTASDAVAASPQLASQRTTASDNPLAGRTWGVFKGSAEFSWDPYVNSTGVEHELLAKIALEPKAMWFGHWNATRHVADRVAEYIAGSQAGDPEALVQMTIFRMVPWEHEACTRLPTPAEQASYKDWTNRFASAIGNTPTAIVLQPDGPFALCAPGGSKLPSRLLAYSAKVLSALPRTSVYIEAGAADWPAPGAKQGGVTSAVKILTRAGIGNPRVRGFALNGTHYSDTNLEVARGAAIIRALNNRGITGKRFVVNTSSNGHPFAFGKYTGADDNNATVCPSKNEPVTRTCITLGIPPTADVANPQWKLSDTTNRLARAYVDGYLWFGRPWLYRQNAPFVKSRALRLASSTPYPCPPQVCH